MEEADYIPVEQENIAWNEQTIRRSAFVQAAGGKIGQVEGIFDYLKQPAENSHPALAAKLHLRIPVIQTEISLERLSAPQPAGQ